MQNRKYKEMGMAGLLRFAGLIQCQQVFIALRPGIELLRFSNMCILLYVFFSFRSCVCFAEWITWYEINNRIT